MRTREDIQVVQFESQESIHHKTGSFPALQQQLNSALKCADQWLTAELCDCVTMFSSAFKSFTSNITSNYELSKQPSASVGVWNIFNAKKRNGGAAASVFVFDRKALDVSSAGGFGAKASSTSVRKAQDEVVERLRREASSLARLRHPSILQLFEPVEDTRSGGLMFATEPVLASLSAALAQKDRGSNNRRRDEGAKAVQDIEVDELEIQKGLLQVAKGLEFLHDSAKLVHGNLTPDAIFINAKSDWKISGLGFAGPPDNAEGHQTLPQLSLSEALYNDPRVPSSVQLNLDYTSPDFVLDSNVNFSADMFSLGLVLLACYKEPHTSPIETHGNQATYKKAMSSPSIVPGPHNNYGCQNKLPRELENTLGRVLARRATGRMTAAEFQQSEYFDNILVNTMRFLDGFPAKTPVEKQSFLRGLPRVMSQFPVSVLDKKILSVLLDELKDKELLSLVLQNIFEIVKKVKNRRDTLANKVLPALKVIFTTPSRSQERDTSKEAGLVVFLENVQIISDNSSAQQFKEDVLPVVHAAMQSTTHSLVDAALSTLSVVLPVLDFSTVKHDLFPVISNVFTKTSSLGIKVRGLEALAVLCGAIDGTAATANDDLSGITNAREAAKTNISSLDKFTQQEKVVPLLKGIKTKEPAVMMTALKVIQQIAKIGDVEFLAAEVMPLLWIFALGPLLDLSQFKAYTDVINALTQKIQREQVKKLQELATVNRSVADSRERASVPSGGGRQAPGQTNGTGTEEDFEKLVLGGKSINSNDPFAGAMEDGQRLVPTQAYSWQATGPGGPATSLKTATLQPMQPQSRSVTPDVPMSSFATLQPASAASVWSQPLQAANPSASSSTQVWGATETSQAQASASASTWSRPLMPQQSSSSRLQATSYLASPAVPAPPTSRTNSSTGFAPILAPPPQSPPPVNPWQQAKPSPMILPMQAQPPAQRLQPQQQQPPSKPAGLDKYQSLI